MKEPRHYTAAKIAVVSPQKTLGTICAADSTFSSRAYVMRSEVTLVSQICCVQASMEGEKNAEPTTFAEALDEADRYGRACLSLSVTDPDE